MEESGKVSPSIKESLSKTSQMYRTAYDGTRTIMKDSPLTVLGLNLKQTPKISEIVEQSKILCEDFIYYRLNATFCPGRLDAVAEENGSSPAGNGTHLPTDVSKEIHLLGSKLEATYPKLYQNISKQTGIPLRSEVAVRKVLTSLGDFMFRHNVVTWGRIVAMFSITASIATECVQNEKPELVRSIINMFSDVIEHNVAAWIRQQGGWVEITKAFRPNKETRSLWALTGVGSVLGFIFTWISTSQI